LSLQPAEIGRYPHESCVNAPTAAIESSLANPKAGRSLVTTAATMIAV